MAEENRQALAMQQNATVCQLLGATLTSTIDRTSYRSQAQPLRHFLANRDSYTRDDQHFVEQTLIHLYSTQGQIRMEELARHANLSPRQLERRYKALTGFTAKMLARLIRFEALRHHLLTKADRRFIDLALDAGYYDQAHCIHDFKALAGCSPQQFVAQARKRSMTDFYNLPDPRPAILTCDFVDCTTLI